MLEASQIRVGTILFMDNELYKVFSVYQSGTAKAEKQVNVPMKSIPAGKFQEKVFHPHDKVENIEPERKKAQYMYVNDENVYFMDENTYEQFPISKSIFGKKLLFIKEGDSFNVLFHNNNPIDIDFPLRIRLKVIQAPPAIRDGSSVYKKIRLEKDIEIEAPQFIKEGDIVEIDPETSRYINRVK
jgi:elongation factor P